MSITFHSSSTLHPTSLIRQAVRLIPSRSWWCDRCNHHPQQEYNERADLLKKVIDSDTSDEENAVELRTPITRSKPCQDALTQDIEKLTRAGTASTRHCEVGWRYTSTGNFNFDGNKRKECTSSKDNSWYQTQLMNYRTEPQRQGRERL